MKVFFQFIYTSIFIFLFTQFVYAEPFNIKSIAFDSTAYRFFALYGNQTQWAVKESSDSGKTWRQVDFFEQRCMGLINDFNCLTPQKIIFKAPSTLVAVGGATENKYIDEWVIRWSTDGGETWKMKRTLYDMRPVYAFNVQPTRDDHIFYIRGYSTGHSSYRTIGRFFDISKGDFVLW